MVKTIKIHKIKVKTYNPVLVPIFLPALRAS